MRVDRSTDSVIDGSPALHLAVQRGQVEIVRLLLHDSSGRPAFELSSTDEILQLFRRPTSDENRFCNVQLSPRSMTFVDSTSIDGVDLPPGHRVEGHRSFHTLREQHSREIDANYSSCRKINNDRWLLQKTEVLSALLDQSIQSTDKQFRPSKALLNEYSSHGRTEPLIRLYSHPTPFSNLINRDKQSSESLASPISNSLSYLRPRAFQGISYRGLSLSPVDVQGYQWAAAKASRSLVVETFCSSTRDISRAEAFAQASQVEGRMEVLILPRTSFDVTRVQVASPRTVIDLLWSQLDREVDEYFTELAFLISTYV